MRFFDLFDHDNKHIITDESNHTVELLGVVVGYQSFEEMK